MTDAPSKTLGEIIGGKENSIVSVFGGELHYDNFNIELLAERGHATNHRIIFGHNMSSYEQTLTNDASYSHIVGYAKVPISRATNGAYKTITSTPVSTGSTRAFPKIKQIDFTDDLRNYFGNTFEITGGTLYPGIQDKLNALTAEKLGEYSGIANKDVNIKIDYRPELDRLNNVALCDTVNVVLGAGSVIKAQVTKVKYDSLAERYKMIEIGDPKPVLPAFFTKKRR
jgi:phage-related protein